MTNEMIVDVIVLLCSLLSGAVVTAVSFNDRINKYERERIELIQELRRAGAYAVVQEKEITRLILEVERLRND